MTASKHLLAAAGMLMIGFGCSEAGPISTPASGIVAETSATEPIEIPNEPATTVAPKTAPANLAVQQEDENKGIFGKARDLYDKSKKAAEMSGKAQQWLSDAIDDTGAGAADRSEAAMKWANKMFKSLKDQGLTTADDAQQWLSDDLKNMEGWEYKVVQLKTTDAPATMEKKLNEIGNQGWECFHVSESANSQMMFFKKAKASYLKRLPLKDLMLLIPIIGAGGG